jgi:hypothetical protein
MQPERTSLRSETRGDLHSSANRQGHPAETVGELDPRPVGQLVDVLALDLHTGLLELRGRDEAVHRARVDEEALFDGRSRRGRVERREAHGHVGEAHHGTRAQKGEGSALPGAPVEQQATFAGTPEPEGAQHPVTASLLSLEHW